MLDSENRAKMDKVSMLAYRPEWRATFCGPAKRPKRLWLAFEENALTGHKGIAVHWNEVVHQQRLRLLTPKYVNKALDLGLIIITPNLGASSERQTLIVLAGL